MCTYTGWNAWQLICIWGSKGKHLKKILKNKKKRDREINIEKQ